MHFVTQLQELKPLVKGALLVLLLTLLQACSGGSSPDASGRAADTGGSSSSTFTYSGPVPANSEIQNFKTAFYDNVVIRCGNCHTRGGVGPTSFVDKTDVNVAYNAAKTVANLLDPSASEVVARVGSGHNCWLSSNATCASTMTGYIERWAAGASASTSTVNLSPRSPQTLAGLKIAPVDYTDYADYAGYVDYADYAALVEKPRVNLTAEPELIWMLRTYCSGCHTGSSPTPQSPYFASEDDSVAYAAMLSKIDLANPANSRFVVRLQNGHQCWSGAAGCNADALEMQNAIARFAAGLDEVSVDSNLVISMAQILEGDGVIASGGGRYDTDVIAKWEFREGEGSQVADTSGVQPEVPLTVLGSFQWVGGWGVRLDSGRIQGAVSGSTKLHDRLAASGEYSIEAWIAPNNVTQEDAWIFGYAAGPNDRNVLLTQTMYNYDFYNRSSANPVSDGSPAVSTADADEIAQATLQHVVLTYDPFNGRKIYVNGMDTGVTDDQGPGLLSNWSNTYAIVMGNDFAGASPWQGVVRMVAVHSRALTPEQIAQNYDVGVGQKYYLMFSVSELIDEEGVCHVINGAERTDYCYIVFEVSQFDTTSYLFKSPRFVNINPDADTTPPLNFNLKGIYLGMNGQLVRTGQGFVNINATINGNVFTIDDTPLQTTGTIVPLENGPDADVFFLAFEEIDGHSDARPDAPIGTFSYSYQNEEKVQIGMRTFDEINESFSHITGVPKDSTYTNVVTGKTIGDTFDTVRRSLPSTADFQTFMASHQMAVMQLAAAYCNALVEENTSRRDAFFNDGSTAFNFDTPVASVDPTTEWRAQVIVPLIDKAFATGLEISQPTRANDGNNDGNDPLGTAHREELAAALLTLITDPVDSAASERVPDGKEDGLIYCSTGACPASRTREVVKAVCTTVLSSAAATIK